MKITIKKPVRYGHTFLTRIRRTTMIRSKAEQSKHVWGKQGDIYCLTYLGILNGYLNRIGFVLYAEVHRTTELLFGYELTRIGGKKNEKVRKV